MKPLLIAIGLLCVIGLVGPEIYLLYSKGWADFPAEAAPDPDSFVTFLEERGFICDDLSTACIRAERAPDGWRTEIRDGKTWRCAGYDEHRYCTGFQVRP
jgi:hypothetical protein